MPSLKHLLKHIRQVHAHKPGFNITCHLNGCTKHFRSFEVFRNHVYGFHTDADTVMFSTPSDNEDEDIMAGDTSDVKQDSFSLTARKKAAATWILKVQETYKLPQSTMTEILKDVTSFIQDMLDDLYNDVKTTLSDAEIDCATIPGLPLLFGPDSKYATPFAGLETQYSQLKFYRDALEYIVSMFKAQFSHVLIFVMFYPSGTTDSSPWRSKEVGRIWLKKEIRRSVR